MRCLDNISDSMDMGLSKLREVVRDREAWHAAVHGVTKDRTRLSDWTTTCEVVGNTTQSRVKCYSFPKGSIGLSFPY